MEPPSSLFGVPGKFPLTSVCSAMDIEALEDTYLRSLHPRYDPIQWAEAQTAVTLLQIGQRHS
jgi:hypothetical protein